MTEDQKKMSNHWRETYQNHPERYEKLISHEDYQGNLLKKIEEIVSLAGKTVVEFGAGTGKVSVHLLPVVKQLFAFDFAPKMLEMGRNKLASVAAENEDVCWGVSLGDNRQMPIADEVADVALEGWSFGHLKTWYPERWEEEVEAAINEIERVTRPGGITILIETKGTGQTTPRSHPALVPFEAYIENKRGYAQTWVRTDYRYASPEAARASVSPMFGIEMLDDLVETEDGFVLHECTGIWWKRKG